MRKLLLTIAILMTTFSAMASDHNPRGQVFGSIGLSLFNNARSFTENYTEASLGFGVGLRPTSHFGFRGDVNYLTVDNHAFAYPHDSELWDYGGDLMYFFSSSSTQPYVFAGARAIHYHEISGAPSFPGVFEQTINSFGIDFGGGLQHFASHKISFRPEFRVLYDTDLDEHNEQHSYILNFTLSMGYNW
jgi:hypothetical protein